MIKRWGFLIFLAFLTIGFLIFPHFFPSKPQWVERNGHPCVVYQSHLWCRP